MRYSSTGHFTMETLMTSLLGLFRCFFDFYIGKVPSIIDLNRLTTELLNFQISGGRFLVKGGTDMRIVGTTELTTTSKLDLIYCTPSQKSLQVLDTVLPYEVARKHSCCNNKNVTFNANIRKQKRSVLNMQESRTILRTSLQRTHTETQGAQFRRIFGT